jgi:hypothetical protein
MVAEHERMHMDLNGHCSFGNLLVRIGKQVDRTDSSEVALAWRTRLGELVELCRTTHEVYATPISLWHTVRSADDALNSYPDYRRYLELGRELSQGFVEWSMAAEYLIVTACWVAMAIPLHDLLGECDETTLDPVSIPDALRPDVRLRAILDRRDSLDFSWLAETVPESWLTDRAREVTQREIISRASFLEMTTTISIRLYLQYGELLEAAGMPVLEWDGHCKYTSARIADTPAPPALLSCSAEGASADYVSRTVKETLLGVHPRLSLETYEEERLIRRDPAGHLHVRNIAGFPVQSDTDWALVDFVVDTPIPHILIIVRPVELIIEQYSPDDRTIALLRAAARGGVVTAARAIAAREEGEIFTVLALLTEHEHLSLLCRLPTEPGRYPPDIISSTSLSCLFAGEWSEYWMVPFHLLSSPVTLCDMLPSNWITMLEASEETVGVTFSTVQLRPPPDHSLSHVDALSALVVERADADGMMDRWTVFFGSPGVIGALAGTLTDQATIKARISADPSRSTSPAAAVLQRLSGEEPWFDPMGISYVQVESASEPRVDRELLALWFAVRRSLQARQATWREQSDDRQLGEEP